MKKYLNSMKQKTDFLKFTLEYKTMSGIAYVSEYDQKYNDNYTTVY